MKVIRVNQFTAAFVNPGFFQDGLAVRTVAVTAGIRMEIQMTAFFTTADVVTESAGFTVHNGVCGTGLFLCGLEMAAVGIPAIMKYLLDFSHERHLPSDRGDLLRWRKR